MNALPQDPCQIIDELSLQISRDLEERVWLRKLTEHLDCCQADSSIVEVAGRILPSLCKVISAESVVLVLEPVEKTGHRAVHIYGEPWPDAAICGKLVDLLQGRADKRVIVRNGLDQEVDIAQYGGVTSCMLGKLQRQETVFGWLLAVDRWFDPKVELGKDEFGTVEADLLASAASLLATHAQNVQLFREKERLLTGAVKVLVRALETHDPINHGHTERVAVICKSIGQSLRLSERECERLYLSGLLHDVGMIGVPGDLLNKIDRLTENEFARIKMHSEIGYDILRELAPLQDVLPAILHHHERVDGLGYPHGLAGDDIPLFARILAVADAYDAMVSDRTYRRGMPSEKAEALLRQGAGTQWDARIVEAFLTILPSLQAASFAA
jgi:hypothetical protein